MSYQEEHLAKIADAIRTKEGSTEPIIANEFAARINALTTSESTGGVRTFNGRTGVVVPQAGDYDAEMVGALPTDGGTVYGDLNIQPSGGGTYGGKLNFGDGDKVSISEPTNDCLEIAAKKINFSVSDTTDQKFTLNGQPIGADVDTSGLVPVTRTINGKPLNTDIVLSANDINGISDIVKSIRVEITEGDANTESKLTEYVDGKLSTGTSSGVRSFNGRTGAVIPQAGDYTSEMVGAFSEDGGTVYGDVRIQPSGTYGGKLNFGEGDFVELSEPTDDCLQVKAKRINFVVTDQTDDRFTLNGEPIGGLGGNVVTAFNGRTGDVYPEAGDYSADFIGAVPIRRTVNGKPLSTDITLVAEDVFAVPSSRTINGKPLTTNITLTANDLGISGDSVQIQDVQNLLNRTTAVNIANTSYSTIMARGIYAGTAEMTAGSSSLVSGVIYLQYE